MKLAHVSQAAGLFLLLLASLVARADREDTDTGIEGTESADTISVTDPTAATAETVAISAETLTSTATAIDSLGGDDVVSTSIDEISPTLSSALAGGVFLDLIEVNLDAPPLQQLSNDHSVKTVTSATGINAGDGNDIVNNNSVLISTANSISGANGVEVNAAGSGELTTKTEATAEATATGIKTGAGADQVLNSLAISSTASATAESVAADIAAADTENPDRNVKSHVEANVKAEVTATGIETEDDATETVSESTSPLDGGGLRFTSSETVATVSGDDRVTNTGVISTSATALGGDTSVGVSAQSSGTSSSSADVTAAASSQGISTGGGNDSITTSGDVSTGATATAGAVALTVSIANPPPPSEPGSPGTSDDDDVGSSTTNVTTSASATGIDAEGSGHSQTIDRVKEIADGALHISRQTTATSVAGDDTVDNFGIVDTTAGATSKTESADVTVSTGGSASSEANVAASARSVGVHTGAGNDTINNNAALTSAADATAVSTNISVAAGQSTENPNPDSPAQTHEIAASSEGKIESSATAIGIDAEGGATFESSGYDLVIGTDGLSVSRDWGTTAEAGDDTINNVGYLTSTADASSETGSVGMQFDASGSVGSNTDSSAVSRSTGIYSGGGNDTITNAGIVDADATSAASAAAVGLTINEAPAADNSDPNVKPGKSNIASDAKVTSSATATGIDAEGSQHNDTGSVSLDISRNSLAITYQKTQTSLAGVDTVDNQGAVFTNATATSGTVAASIAIETAGSTNTNAESAASADAVGVATGGDADDITNDGALTAISLANAAALSVGVSVSQPPTGSDPTTSILDKLKDRFASTHNVANVSSASSSTGIDAEGSEHDVEQTVVTTINGDGLSVTVDRTSVSDAGDDIVSNSGAVLSLSEAASGAGAADVDIQTGGTASAEANAESRAAGSGILTGGGADTVTNTGAVATTALSAAGTISVAFSQDGPGAKSKSDAKTKSDAIAVGVGTDNGSSVETANHSLTISENGIDVALSQTATANRGADTVTNSGLIDTRATSASGAVGVAVTIDGAASTDVTSTANATANGLDTGGGGDTVDNEGVINTNATADALAIGVGFGQNQTETEKPKVKVGATTGANATATGIAADSGADTTRSSTLSITADGLTASYTSEVTAATGDDVVDSRFAITTSASAESNSESVSVAIDGTAKADAESKAASNAAGIVGGGGNDQVTNSGAITATGTADADAIAVAVGEKKSDASKASTVVSAETESKATATGIASDGGTENSLLDVDLTIDTAGIDISYTKSTSTTSGDDTLNNSGAILSNAWADTGLVATAVTIKGSARSTVEASATATAHGLDAGGGADNVTNSGLLESGAFATANTANAAVSTQGKATANSGIFDSGTKAKADAFGISSAGADHATSTTITSNVSFTDFSATGSFEKVSDGVTGDGADTVANSGAIVAASISETAQANIAVDASKEKVGLALTIGRSESAATATGIASGNADDTIDNSGAILTSATALGAMGNVSFSAKGLAVAANSAWDGGTVATATAAGIDSDSGSIETQTVDVDANIGDLSAQVVYTKTIEAASGNDTITNSGAVGATAISGTASGSIAASVKGVAAAVSTSKSEAQSFAIKAGDGDDRIENAGALESHATANAATANISLTNQGVSAATDAVWDGGTTAEATAIGIAGDGGNRLETTRIAIGTEEMGYDKTAELASGADSILNLGTVDVTAAANAASFSAAVSMKGVAGATATSTAKATSTAIHAGEGSDVDDVYNGGDLTSSARADAVAASFAFTNAGLSIAADAVWDGGTSAEATARGIDVGAGGETLVNDGAVTADATAAVASVSVGASVSGAAAASATSTGTADSIALDASDGDDVDTVINTGVLTARATSGAAAASVGFVQTGVAIAAGAVWDGGTGSTARSRGIDVGNAGDTVQNSGQVNADSRAGAAEAAVSVALTGVAGAITTATSESDAAAIDAGQDTGADTVVNDGELNVDSTAVALTAGVGVTQAGAAVVANAFWDGGTNSHSTATGIDTGDGADTIRNTGDVNVLNGTSDIEEVVENADDVLLLHGAGAITAAGSVSVAVSGVAGASAQATAISDATGIDAGDDDAVDVIENSGSIDVDTSSFAGAASVGVTTAGVSANWNAGNEASATGRGIYTGEGGDTIDNEGDVDVLAASLTAEVNVSVAVSGVTGAVSEQGVSRSEATAIDTGSGAYADTVRNTGQLDATAESRGASASVGVTTAGVAATWNGGTLGDSDARGIDVGDGADEVRNEDSVTATAVAKTKSAAITVAVAGVAGAVSTAEAEADATAIDAGDDDSDDVVANLGDLFASSEAAAASAAVSVTAAGVAGSASSPFDGGTTSRANATGAFLGGGNDTFSSDGSVGAESSASATGVSVAVAVEGVAGAITTSTSSAYATGVDAASGNDTIEAAGSIAAHSDAIANTVNAAGTKFGVSAAGNNAWDGGTTAIAGSTGIATGDGLDTVLNSAEITSMADATAPATTVAFNVAGVATAISTSTAEASATAIDTGADDDQIDNSGLLTVDSDADAVTVNISITGAGVSAAINSFDGGTTGTATSTGIDAGQGADLVINSGDMDVDSSASAPAVTVAVAVAGAAAASSVSTADVGSEGIDGGDGDDRIDNSGNLDVDADSTAVAVDIAFTGGGVTGSVDGVWDGGTTGSALATGINGGAGNDTITSSTGVLNDTMAAADAYAVSAAISGGGYGVAVTKSTSNARADGINAGEGTDLVINDSDILSTADADATSVSASVVGTGVAAAGTPNWDGGTTANADAAGIRLGGGDDQASNSGNVTSAAEADTIAAAVAGTPSGGLALSDATSTANATSTGMGGEQGDDVLVNDGGVAANSTAIARGLNASFTAAGPAVAGGSAFLDNGTTANALSVGVSGGDGSDGLRNATDATVSLDANARTIVASASLTLAGIAAAGANAIANSDGIGIDGGANDDMLVNEGLVTGTSDATATGLSLTITGLGAGVAEASASGLAGITGMAGGGGADMMDNTGTIELTATSRAAGVSLAGSQLGFSLAKANAEGESGVVGLDGGDGTDLIINSGVVDLRSNVITDARSLGIALEGGSLSESVSSAFSSADGIRGGLGDDTIINSFGGDVVVESSSRVNADGFSISGLGANGSKAGTLADTRATGIRGEAGADTIVNEGNVSVGQDPATAGWMSVLDTSSFSMGLAGASSAESESFARTASIGIDGGDDDDQIASSGTVSVFANALSTSTGSNVTIFGSGGSASTAGAITSAAGILGGLGNDWIESSGALNVTGSTRLVQSGGATYSFGGTSTSDASLAADTAVHGILGGDGADIISNSGSIIVHGLAEMSSTGDSDTTFGESVTNAISGGTTDAVGISGGHDDDRITHAGVDAQLDVEARVSVSADSGSYTFLGPSATDIALTGSATALGISGGDGADVIDGDGSVSVAARADLQARGGAKTSATVASGGESFGAATTDTSAVGYDGGAGNDNIATGGNLSVVSESISGSNNTTSNAAAIVSKTRAEAKADASSAAKGFDLSEGGNSVTNSGNTFVRAHSSGNSVAYANGAKVSITGTATAEVESTATATAKGVVGGSDAQTIVNAGDLTVVAEAGTTQPITVTTEVLSIEVDANPDDVQPTSAPDYEGQTPPEIVTASDGSTNYEEGDVVFWNGEMDADGNGPVDDPLISSPGSFYQLVSVTANGATSLEWQFAPVTAYQQTRTSDGANATEAGARGHGTNGNGVAHATGTTNASAVGIELGAADDDVWNSGDIEVTARSVAFVKSNANGSSTGDATASATATANADAAGVLLGDGNNSLVNDGSILVVAIADATADARTDAGDGLCVTILFWEFCIAPGTANDPINTESVNTYVAGVLAGDGNDTIVNNGTISATYQDVEGNVLGYGIGIDTGDGNDSLQLGDGSLVVGSVSLGTGNDTLVLAGAPRVENHLGESLPITAGEGNDSLVLSGSGAYYGILDSFEYARKTDAGTYWLNSLDTVAALTVDGGILELGADYLFGVGSTYSTFVHSDLSYGGLLVNGVATIGGAVAIERRGGDFIENGTRYPIVAATNGISGAFGDVSLPAPWPLLSFELETDNDSVDVVAHAASFASVTDVPLHATIAANLDSIAPASSGDLREQLGTLQTMGSGFDDAFASLSPDMHHAGTTNTITVTLQTTQLLRSHLGNARSVARGTLSPYGAYNPVTVQYDGLMASAIDASLAPAALGAVPLLQGSPAPRGRTWLLGFAGDSEVDLQGGYTDYDQNMTGFAVGADWMPGPSVIAGAALAFSDSSITMDKAAARTGVKSWAGSLYATAFSDRAYVEGGLYFGRQDFDTERTLVIGDVTRNATSGHDGRVTMAFLGAGRPILRDGWNVEPFATVYYFDLGEDGFEETGAGDLNQVVAKKSSERLLGELGALFNWMQLTGSGVLDWKLSFGYNHDFEIDDAAVTYAFAGAPNDFFRILDRNIAGGSAAVGAGVAYVRDRTVLSLDYRNQWNSDYRHEVIGARFSYAF